MWKRLKSPWTVVLVLVLAAWPALSDTPATRALMDVLKLGDLAEIQAAFDGASAALRAEPPVARRLLCYAASACKTEVLEQLLKRKDIDKNFVALRDHSPLHTAAWSGNYENVEFLLKHGFPVDHPDKDGNLPIHTAVKRGHRDVVELLAVNGADINKANKEGSCLYIAGIRAFGLPEKGAWPGGHEPHFDILTLLVNLGADVSAREASGKSFYDQLDAKVKALLKTPDAELDIWEAINLGRPGRVAQLVARDPAVVRQRDSKGDTPIVCAAITGYHRIANLLIEKGADAKAREGKRQFQRTPFSVAAHRGTVQVAKVLLKHGADVNAKDSRGWTPIMSYSRGGEAPGLLPTTLSTEMERFLIRNGAAVDLQTAIHLADRAVLNTYLKAHPTAVKKEVAGHLGGLYDNFASIKVLIAAGWDINMRDKSGWSILHRSAAAGSIPPARLRCLLSAGADINARDNAGLTPLGVLLKVPLGERWLFGSRREEEIRALRECGAVE